MASRNASMNWAQLARRIASVAPSIGTALSGPLGAQVGTVIADRLGVPATPAAVAEARRVDPEFEVKLAEIEREMQAAKMADVQRARETYKGHWLPPFLTVLLVLMAGGLMGALFFITIPEPNRDMVNFALGNMFGWAGAGVMFWLGSSRGSAEKQEMMRVNRDQEG